MLSSKLFAAFAASLDLHAEPRFTRRSMILNAFTLLALHAASVPQGLVALQAIQNEALKGNQLPTRLKLLNWGDNETATKGIVKVGPNTLKSLAANQAKFGFDRIALDYDHNSLPGHPNFQPNPRKVAGYGAPIVIEGEGLFVDALSYTPSGTEHAREYSDLSPTPLLDENGEVTFLHSVALCPQGEVRGLTFLSADFLKPLSAKHTAVVSQAKTMDYKKLLCTLLGIDPNSEDSDIQTAAETLAKKSDATATGDGEMGKAIAMAIKPLAERLTALTASFEKVERESIEADALREGKVIPLSAKSLPVEAFRKLVSELPAGTVPVEQRTPENVQAFSVANPGDTGAAQVCQLLGIQKADFDKTK